MMGIITLIVPCIFTLRFSLVAQMQVLLGVLGGQKFVFYDPIRNGREVREIEPFNLVDLIYRFIMLYVTRKLSDTQFSFDPAYV